MLGLVIYIQFFSLRATVACSGVNRLSNHLSRCCGLITLIPSALAVLKKSIQACCSLWSVILLVGWLLLKLLKKLFHSAGILLFSLSLLFSSFLFFSLSSRSTLYFTSFLFTSKGFTVLPFSKTTKPRFSASDLTSFASHPLSKAIRAS